MLEPIEVSGSLIRRSDYETAQPIRLLTRAEIEASGALELGDLLRQLPQAGPSPSRAQNFGGTGASQLSLRALGSSRVLVLVNGRRWVGGVGAYAHAPIDIAEATSTSVDLNTIPLAIVEHVEILTDGASATYGSDALTGVINIRTRSDFVGTQLSGHVGATLHGDGWNRQLGLLHGFDAGGTNVFLAASHDDQGEIMASDRAESSEAVLGTGVSRALPASPDGRFAFLPVPGNPEIPADERCYDVAANEFNSAFANRTGNALNPNVPPLPGMASPIRVCDLTRGAGAPPQPDYVRWDQNVHARTPKHLDYLITPNVRSGLYAQLTRTLAGDVEASAELFYHRRRSRQQFGEAVLAVGDLLGPPFNLAYVDASNPYNPFGQDVGRAMDGEVPYALGIVLRRVSELGPRKFEQDVDSYRVALRLEGVTVGAAALDWNAGYVFSESVLDQSDGWFLDLTRVARALGPASACTMPCVPADLFHGPGTLTPAMLDYIRHFSYDRAVHTTHQVAVTTTGALPWRFKFLPGVPDYAVGAEFRSAAYVNRPDPLKVAGTHSEIGVAATLGQNRVGELFGELTLPLAARRRFAEEVDLTLAARYSEYSGLGGQASGKVGMRWKPHEEVLLRATLSDAYRAPSITELHLGQTRLFTFVADPCVQWTDSTDANVRANCASDGVPPDLAQLPLSPVVFGGNPRLQPEEGRTVSAGVVFAPAGTDLEAVLDAYRFDGVGFIGPLDAATVMNACYRRAPGDRSLCEYRTRDGTGMLSEVRSVNANADAVAVRGVDFDLRWRPHGLQLAGGSWLLSLRGSYLDKHDVTRFGASGAEVTEHRAGRAFAGYFAYPRLRLSPSVQWVRGPWSSAWNARYLHRMTYPCDDHAQNGAANPTPVRSLAELGLCSDPDHPSGPRDTIAGTVYHDLQLSYASSEHLLELSLGALNVLDQDPPPIYTAQDDSYNKALYEPWGSRALYIRAAKGF